MFSPGIVTVINVVPTPTGVTFPSESIVATAVGGNVEAVIDGKTGYLVPPSEPEALSSAMERIAKMPAEERDAMGDAARTHAGERFDLQRILDRWEELYTKLIKQKCRLTETK